MWGGGRRTGTGQCSCRGMAVPRLASYRDAGVVGYSGGEAVISGVDGGGRRVGRRRVGTGRVLPCCDRGVRRVVGGRPSDSTPTVIAASTTEWAAGGGTEARGAARPQTSNLGRVVRTAASAATKGGSPTAATNKCDGGTWYHDGGCERGRRLDTKSQTVAVDVHPSTTEA